MCSVEGGEVILHDGTSAVGPIVARLQIDIHHIHMTVRRDPEEQKFLANRFLRLIGGHEGL